MSNKRHTEAYIWRGIDEEEIESLADVMLQRAQTSVAVAQVVRGIVSLFQELQILIILGPRFLATWRFYRDNGGFAL